MLFGTWSRSKIEGDTTACLDNSLGDIRPGSDTLAYQHYSISDFSLETNKPCDIEALYTIAELIHCDIVLHIGECE